MKKLWLSIFVVILTGCRGALTSIDVTRTSIGVTPTIRSQQVDQTPQPTDAPAMGFVEGRVSVGPLTPGPQRADETPQPIPPEVFAQYLIRVYQAMGTQPVLDAKINPDGTYRIGLQAGSYMIGAIRADGGRMFGGGGQQPIEIQSGQTLQLDISIDTGMR